MRREQEAELGLVHNFNPHGEQDPCPVCGEDHSGECPLEFGDDGDTLSAAEVSRSQRQDAVVRQKQSPCQHTCRMGDNYGTTCMTCGEHLQGYGHWGKGGSPCRHGNYYYEEGRKICVYCEREV